MKSKLKLFSSSLPGMIALGVVAGLTLSTPLFVYWPSTKPLPAAVIHENRASPDGGASGARSTAVRASVGSEKEGKSNGAHESASASEQTVRAMRLKIAALEELKARVEEAREARYQIEEKEMVGRIIARHPEWTGNTLDEQLRLLEWKYRNSNRSDERECIFEMETFGRAVCHSELTEEDYRDKHLHRYVGSPERVRLSQQEGRIIRALEKLKGDLNLLMHGAREPHSW